MAIPIGLSRRQSRRCRKLEGFANPFKTQLGHLKRPTGKNPVYLLGHLIHQPYQGGILSVQRTVIMVAGLQSYQKDYCNPAPYGVEKRYKAGLPRSLSIVGNNCAMAFT